MTNEEIAIQQHLSHPRPWNDACGCMGPQGDDPLCPCEMNWCERVNGSWYKITEERTPDGIKLKASAV